MIRGSSQRHRARVLLFRLKRIAEYVREERPFTCTTIAQKLEVSAKTIHRDIDFMRDFLGYDLSFDLSTNTWRGRPPEQRIL